jgi:hypothetical protein
VQSKLHIDMSQGVVDIEGDSDLVREIYRDLKDHLLNGAPLARVQPRAPAGVPTPEAAPESKPKSKRRAVSRKKVDAEGGSSGVSVDAPKLDKNLDTSKLAGFYEQYEPKNHSDKILIFLKFITEELELESPNTDQVYTCYKKTGEKIPKAYGQAFYTMSSRHGYIDFRSPTDIGITIAGDNHFNHELKKAAE